MTDLDRWFNELTHRYLEIIRIVHLHCYDEWLMINVVAKEYRAIKLKPDPFLNETELAIFSGMLDTIQDFIRQRHQYP